MIELFKVRTRALELWARVEPSRLRFRYMNPVPHVSPHPLSCGIGPNSAAVEEWDPIIVCPMPYLQLTTFYGPWVRVYLGLCCLCCIRKGKGQTLRYLDTEQLEMDGYWGPWFQNFASSGIPLYWTFTPGIPSHF